METTGLLFEWFSEGFGPLEDNQEVCDLFKRFADSWHQCSLVGGDGIYIRKHDLEVSVGSWETF